VVPQEGIGGVPSQISSVPWGLPKFLNPRSFKLPGWGPGRPLGKPPLLNQFFLGELGTLLPLFRFFFNSLLNSSSFKPGKLSFLAQKKGAIWSLKNWLHYSRVYSFFNPIF